MAGCSAPTSFKNKIEDEAGAGEDYQGKVHYNSLEAFWSARRGYGQRVYETGYFKREEREMMKA